MKKKIMQNAIFAIIFGTSFGQWFDVDPFANSAFQDSGKSGPVRYSFVTSNIPSYANPGEVLMQVRIDLFGSYFRVRNDCADLWTATGGFPTVSSCRFSDTSATLYLSRPLLPENEYSVTILTRLSAGRLPDVNGQMNEFDLSVLQENGTLIEKSGSRVELTRRVELNAGTYDVSNSASLTGFQLVSQSSQLLGVLGVQLVFSISWTGTFDRRYVFEFHAMPSDVWNLGPVGSNCPGYESMRLIPGSACVLAYFPNRVYSPVVPHSNGFRILIGETNAISVSASNFVSFRLLVNNPLSSTNLPWIAVTRRVNGFDKGRFCSSQILSVPLIVQGVPYGAVSRVNATSVTITIVPSIGILPYRAGILLIQSPDSSDWTFNYTQKALFPDTRIEFSLTVPAFSSVYIPPFSWTVTVLNSVDGQSILLGSSQTIRGVSVPVRTFFMVYPTSALAGALAVRMNFQFELDRSTDRRIVVSGPSGFRFGIVCKHFILDACTCRGSREHSFEINCLVPDGVPDPEIVSIDMLVDNPAFGGLSGWVIASHSWDGAAIRVGTAEMYPLYSLPVATELSVFAASRKAGLQNVTLTFVLASDMLEGSELEFRSPILWTSAVPVNWSITQSFNGTVVIGERLFAGSEYALLVQVVVPPITPNPNRWWLQSMSQIGFKTQTLNPLTLEVYDQVFNSFQNLIAFRFSPTTNAETISITAPLGFVFICRSLNHPYLPQPLQPFSCQVTPGARHSVLFGAHLLANTPYLLVAALANPGIDPGGIFNVSTSSEWGSVPVFPLRNPLTNTQYLAQPGREDRRSGARNSVTFAWDLPSLSIDTVITLTAPAGFIVCEKIGAQCVISSANFLSSRYSLIPSSTCTCPEAVSIARLVFRSAISAGVYGAVLSVINPMRTPIWNVWKLTTPTGQAPWIYGFRIQEIFNVSLISLNPSIDDPNGSAYVRPIEVFFNTSTLISASSQLPAEFRIRAPEFFWTDVKYECRIEDISNNPSSRVSCSLDENDTRIVHIAVWGIKQPGRYGYRISQYRNPPMLISSGIWSITSYLSGGDVADMAEDIPSFQLTERIVSFIVQPENKNGNTYTDILFRFVLAGPLHPGGTVTITAPTGILFANNETVAVFRNDATGSFWPAHTLIIQSSPSVYNPAVTPNWNYWQISTSTGEAWGIEGYTITPQLILSLTSSNPAFGLFTEFRFTITTITPLLPGGSLLIFAPGLLSDFALTGCPFEFVQSTIGCMYGTVSSREDGLKIQFGPDVVLPGDATLEFTVSGHNALSLNFTWEISTWNIDSGAQPVNSFVTADPFLLLDPILVDPITCTVAAVSAASNRVTLSFVLPHPVADMDLYFPSSFGQKQPLVTLGPGFPPGALWKSSLNRVHVNSVTKDPIPANSVLNITLVLANPIIGPESNFWAIQTINGINRRIPGFNIYGSFDSVSLVGRVLAPNKTNTVGISFVLSSDLPRNNTFPATTLELKFPSVYVPSGECSMQYTRYEGADAQFGAGKSFIGLPAASVCVLASDGVTIALDSPLSAGIAYAFQIGVLNPKHTPEDPLWQIFTKVNKVVLHRDLAVSGLLVKEIQSVNITAANPSRGAEGNKITVSVVSEKIITGGSIIVISHPLGFLVSCRGILLSPQFGRNTACATPTSVILELRLDTSNDVISPLTNWWIEFAVINPQRTPWNNLWDLQILTSGRVPIDVKSDIFAFDITGILLGSVAGKFVYINQKTLVSVQFVPSTTQARARTDNVLAVTAPPGFVSSCNKFAMNTTDLVYTIPFSGRDCAAFGNATILVRFKRGFALHASRDYQLEFEVVNAKSRNVSSSWTITTQTNGHVMDSNSSIPGYKLASKFDR